MIYHQLFYNRRKDVSNSDEIFKVNITWNANDVEFSTSSSTCRCST